MAAVRRRWVGLAGGLVGAGATYVLLPADLDHAARLTAATAVLMGLWWMTEAIPIPATALVPLAVFPVLTDAEIADVGASYGDSIIFLFMGGFLLALAMQRWNLHRRIALLTVRAMGTDPSMVVGGFMIATGFLSMWVSNTATALMMLPIAVSVLLIVAPPQADGTPTDPGGAPSEASVKQAVISSRFGTALMLGIAYAASIGSLGTIIGTPPNALLVGYMDETFDVSIGFGQWMLVGVPLAVVFLVITWFVLTKVLYTPEIDQLVGSRDLLTEEISELGPTSSAEKRVLAVFVLAATAWVGVPLLQDDPFISDAGIAVVIGLLLFVLPAGAARGVRLLDWATAVALPWGVLLLFGGGLALSAQFTASGLSTWIGEQVSGLDAIPLVLLVALVVAGIVLLTELTSNTATAATFLPVAGGAALGLGLDPLVLTVPVAIAASCAFMLPVATPPNAIAYGSGYVTIGQMTRGGVALNLIGVVLITVVAMTLVGWVFGLTA